MKSALTKDTFREIKKSFGRFISIFGIVLVGVAFFVGVKASAPYMEKSADDYMDRTNFLDLKIYSNVGFDDGDVDSVKNVDGIKGAQGIYSFDVVTTFDTTELTYQLMSYDFELSEEDNDNLNRLTLVEGRMPQKSGECVVRENNIGEDKIKLGMELVFESGTDIGIENSLVTDTYTVVGIVKTPYYLSYQYDSTTVGSGKISSVFFIPEEDFKLMRYTAMFATIEGAAQKDCYGDEYFDIVTPVKEKVENLEHPEGIEWYVLDRNSHFSYVDYGNCGDRMDAIAAVFPVFFYLVAALVCLTTMTRMVDEQRGNIGTLKALGYGKFAIASKYVIYALSASLLGGIAGCLIGLKVFPSVIFNAWNTVYAVDGMVATPQGILCVLAVVIAVLVNVIATISACLGGLMENSALLLRPKAPKNGKKVFLEYIPFIWKRFSFSKKVTARNILRYKKRFFMTVIGISGCTALVLAGFGIKNSVAKIVDVQYGEIFSYNILGTFGDNCDKEAFYLDYSNQETVDELYIMTQISGNAQKQDEPGETGKRVSVVSVDDATKFSHFTTLRTHEDDEVVYIPKEGVLVSYKLAKDYNVGKGDYIYINISEDEYCKVQIADIITMYVGQYVFMSDEYYEEVFNIAPEHKQFVANINVEGNDLQQAWGTKLMEKYDIEGISYYDGIESALDDTMASLDIITVVLIVSAALLAFVVLYNLTNVNISERIREIATIKVLGFYDNEVSAYVYRENVILSIVGSSVGLLLGKILHSYIMNVIEMDDIIFPKAINGMSYLYSFVITILFGVIVNLVMNKKLKKIPMVESLKSVE